jgi:hypothetical protein
MPRSAVGPRSLSSTWADSKLLAHAMSRSTAVAASSRSTVRDQSQTGSFIGRRRRVGFGTGRLDFGDQPNRVLGRTRPSASHNGRPADCTGVRRRYRRRALGGRAHRGRSDIGQRERARLAAVEVCEPVLSGQRGCTTTCPLQRSISGFPAKAATARPMNCGLPELLRSKTPAASTASVRASPGYSETAVTPWRRSPCVMSAVSLSVAAFATPYSTFPMNLEPPRRRGSR